MGITPRLSRKLNQVLGEEAEDLVTWMDHVDAQRAEWREAMRADFAELRQDIVQVEGRLRLEIQELRQDMQVGFATLRQEMALMEARFERRMSDIIKWSFVFWVGAVGAIAMLAGVLR